MGPGPNGSEARPSASGYGVEREHVGALGADPPRQHVEFYRNAVLIGQRSDLPLRRPPTSVARSAPSRARRTSSPGDSMKLPSTTWRSARRPSRGTISPPRPDRLSLALSSTTVGSIGASAGRRAGFRRRERTNRTARILLVVENVSSARDHRLRKQVSALAAGAPRRQCHPPSGRPRQRARARSQGLPVRCAARSATPHWLRPRTWPFLRCHRQTDGSKLFIQWFHPRTHCRQPRTSTSSSQSPCPLAGPPSGILDERDPGPESFTKHTEPGQSLRAVKWPAARA